MVQYKEFILKRVISFFFFRITFVFNFLVYVFFHAKPNPRPFPSFKIPLDQKVKSVSTADLPS